MPGDEEKNRRSDDKKIEALQLAVARIEANIVAVKEAREVSQQATVDFRNDLKSTIVDLTVQISKTNDRLAKLPCDARDVEIGNLRDDVSFQAKEREIADTVLHKRINNVWGVLVTVFLLAFGSIGAVAWGGGRWVGSIAEKVSTQGEWIKDMSALFHSHELQEASRMGLPPPRLNP